MHSEKISLVLGATGMVGKPLTVSLMEAGWTVYGAARFRGQTSMKSQVPNGCLPIRFDIIKDSPEILPDVDVLFLEIWDPTQPELLWEINYYGVGRVVERYAGIADIVNGSTINVYGNRPTAPDEGVFCCPTTEYGLSRLAQEKLIDYFCVRGGTKGIHVRYAHANSAQRGVIHHMAGCILRGVSLGSKPDAFIQVIALEDFVRVTKEAVERLDTPPTAVNCCHPRVWTYRELAERIREELGRGEVVFDRESGGVDVSAYADASRMLDWFGEPKVSLERMIQRVVDRFQ